MFRVDVATIAKPKTLVGRVHSTRIGPSYPTKARILLFLPTAARPCVPPAQNSCPHLPCNSHLPQPQAPPSSKTPPLAKAPPTAPGRPEMPGHHTL